MSVPIVYPRASGCKRFSEHSQDDGRREGAWAEVAKPAAARMASSIAHIEMLERSLLRRGVGALAADRNRCSDCGRTPLVGEHVHLYERDHGMVCELCRPLRREHPAASELVRHSEHGHTVRLAARAA
jgi:hypothetical protein